VGRLIAVEGVDGAGKRTFADGIEKAFHDVDRSVYRFAFPRYGQSLEAARLREALYGQVGDQPVSVYGMAALYALDRAGVAEDLHRALGDHDIVLIDRYVSSNAAYGAARLGQGADGEFVQWVRSLEVERLRLPLPNAQVLLRVSGDVAADRARQRAIEEPERARDDFETDGELQARVAAVYEELAASGWLSPWHVVDGVGDIDDTDLVTGLLQRRR